MLIQAKICGDCLGTVYSFSVALIKQHDQDNVRKRGFVWAYGSREIRV